MPKGNHIADLDILRVCRAVDDEVALANVGQHGAPMHAIALELPRRAEQHNMPCRREQRQQDKRDNNGDTKFAHVCFAPWLCGLYG